jgi:hypothetical protein
LKKKKKKLTNLISVKPGSDAVLGLRICNLAFVVVVVVVAAAAPAAPFSIFSIDLRRVLLGQDHFFYNLFTFHFFLNSCFLYTISTPIRR